VSPFFIKNYTAKVLRIIGQIVLIDGIEPQKGSFNRAEWRFVMDSIPLMSEKQSQVPDTRPCLPAGRFLIPD